MKILKDIRDALAGNVIMLARPPRPNDLMIMEMMIMEMMIMEMMMIKLLKRILLIYHG